MKRYLPTKKCLRRKSIRLRSLIPLHHRLRMTDPNRRRGRVPAVRGAIPAVFRPTPPDVDCSDVDGPIQVTGDDPHGLDRDGDGVGCEAG
jgi:hypothetical protein